jgi:cobalamin synthase
MGEALRLTAVAFQFLTRLPVPQIRVADGDLRRASAAFPLVGIVVAGIAVRAGAGALWGRSSAPSRRWRRWSR